MITFHFYANITRIYVERYFFHSASILINTGKKHPKTSEKGHKYTFLSSSGFDSSSDGKTSACDAGDLGSIPGSGRSLGEGNGNPLQYPCLENPHGQRILVGYSPWGRKELDTTYTYTAKHSLFLFSLSPG